MAVIVSPISGKSVDTIDIDSVYGLLAADLVALYAGAGIDFRYPEMERTYGEYGAMIKEGRVPAAEGRNVNPNTTALCDPAYLEMDSKVYDNWLEAVYPVEIRRVDLTKVVTDQASYEDLLSRIVFSTVEGYKKEVNTAIDRMFLRTIPTGGDGTVSSLIAFDIDNGIPTPDSQLLGNRYEMLEGAAGAPTFRQVWSEILATCFDMVVENNTYTEGNNVYGAKMEDLVIYVPHKFLAYSDIGYVQRLFNERGLNKLPEIRTHNGGEGDHLSDGATYFFAYILDKRVINHVTRFYESGSHDVDCRKSRVFDLHVEHMLKYAPFYKAFAIGFQMPTE